jgi:hypothetical protein
MAFIPACDEHLDRARKTIADQYGKPDAEVRLAGGAPPLGKDEPGAAHAPQPLKPTATGHHNLHLPVGTQRADKVKVVHGDGSTSWVQVRAGQITSEDGHPISSRNPGGR